MASSAAARLLLTAVFAGLGGYCLARCALPAARLGHGPAEWVTDALGVATSAAMIAMLWTVPLGDRWGIQLAVFATAGGWYLVRAAPAGTRPGARAGLVHQGAGMVAMLWMLATAHAGTNLMHGSATAGPVGAAIDAYLALAALWWARSALAAPLGVETLPVVLFGPRGGAACQAVMAAAMCTALVVR